MVASAIFATSSFGKGDPSPGPTIEKVAYEKSIQTSLEITVMQLELANYQLQATDLPGGELPKKVAVPEILATNVVSFTKYELFKPDKNRRYVSISSDKEANYASHVTAIHRWKDLHRKSC